MGSKDVPYSNMSSLGALEKLASGFVSLSIVVVAGGGGPAFKHSKALFFVALNLCRHFHPPVRSNTGGEAELEPI